MNYTNKQSGMSLMEVIVVIGIFGVLTSLVLVFGMDFFRTYTMASEEISLVSALSKARARALANYNQNEHGVRISSGQYILFQGDGPNLTWNTRETSLDESIPVGSAMSAGNHDIIFDQLSGAATCSPDCNIDISGSGISKTITINSQGAILW